MGWFKGSMAAVATLVGGIALLLAIGLFGVYGLGWFQRTTADYRGQTSAIERTKADPEFRIASYNEFFDLCGRIQATEDQMRVFQARVDQGGDQQDEAQTNLDAVTVTHASLVREYNQKASRGFTEGQFRSRDLPYQIPVTSQETQCAA